MIDQLKSIGIEKGKPFNPDATNTGDSDDSRARSPCLAGQKYEVSSRPIYEGSRWAIPASPDVSKACRLILQIPTPILSTGAASAISFGFFSPKHLGAGQFYLMTIKDKAGELSTAAGPIASPCRRTRR